MEHGVALDTAGADDATIVVVCPSCAARARAFQQPQIRGVKVTSVVLFGVDGTEAWTVMARRGHDVVGMATGASEEEALFGVLIALGVLT